MYVKKIGYGKEAKKYGNDKGSYQITIWIACNIVVLSSSSFPSLLLEIDIGYKIAWTSCIWF